MRERFYSFQIFLIIIYSFIMIAFNSRISFAEHFDWPQGKHAAVSLTFDDGSESQLDVAIPLLNHYGIKATFYVLPERIIPRLEDWKAAIVDGHEIGNHSMLHPCSANFSWGKEKALEHYTIERMADELATANLAIEKMLGACPVSFAYPCGQKYVGRGKNLQSYVPHVSQMFFTGRSYTDEANNDPRLCDLAQLMGRQLDGLSFDKITEMIEEATKNGSWLILVGHDVGDIDKVTRKEAFDKLCKYLNDPNNGIWTATVKDIASYIDTHRALDKNIPFVKPSRLRVVFYIIVSSLCFIGAFFVNIKTSERISMYLLLFGVFALFSITVWSVRYGYILQNGLFPIFAFIGYCMGCLVSLLLQASRLKK